MTAARLTAVVVRSADLDRDVEVFTAITGTGPTPIGTAGSERHDDVDFVLGDASLTLSPGGGAGATLERGIERLVIQVPNLDVVESELNDTGATIERKLDRIEVGRAWLGVHVEVRSQGERSSAVATAEAALDHVAMLVADPELMARRWAAILQVPPPKVSVHPLGTSMAARFLLGDRMIEVLAPLPDQESPLRTRLERAGDGPLALAIIANDLDVTMAAVSATGARLVDQPPHIVVHPSSASGVPIQLTPRVNH